MKLVSNKYWSILAMAFLSLVFGSNAFAQDPLRNVNGYDGADGPTGVTPSGVSADGSYTVTLTKQIGVAFTQSVAGASQPYRGPVQDQPTKQPVWLYNVPDGSTVYALRLGSNWGDMSKDLNQVDLNKAAARGTIAGGNVTLRFAKGKNACEMVNWVVVTPAGGRFWGSNPSGNSPWLVPNVNGSPRTGWCVQGNSVVTVDAYDPTIRAALAAKE